jgi:hypothetical protein
LFIDYNILDLSDLKNYANSWNLGLNLGLKVASKKAVKLMLSIIIPLLPVRSWR